MTYYLVQNCCYTKSQTFKIITVWQTNIDDSIEFLKWSFIVAHSIQFMELCDFIRTGEGFIAFRLLRQTLFPFDVRGEAE
jgi:hypothetical protein